MSKLFFVYIGQEPGVTGVIANPDKSTVTFQYAGLYVDVHLAGSGDYRLLRQVAGVAHGFSDIRVPSHFASTAGC